MACGHLAGAAGWGSLGSRFGGCSVNDDRSSTTLLVLYFDYEPRPKHKQRDQTWEKCTVSMRRPLYTRYHTSFLEVLRSVIRAL